MRNTRFKSIMTVHFSTSLILLALIGINDSLQDNIEISKDVSGDNDKYLQWTCVNQVCSKSRSFKPDENVYLSLETCRKTCTNHPIWPRPRTLKFNTRKHSQFLKSSLQWNFDAPPETAKILNNYMEIFKGYLKENDTKAKGNSLKIKFKITNKTDVVKLDLGTDEKYDLSVNLAKNINVTIVSPTYFGARHALESLSQLIWFDSYAQEYQILHDIYVEDAPSFTYRGVMVDTARNFFPVSSLKKIVDGMAYSKLNTLHLHLTDAQSFPIVIKNLEWLSEGGAYNTASTYSQQDIEDLVDYCLIRGVRVLLEVDAPSHVSAGWHSSKNYSNLVICDEHDILKGQLNPDNDESLTVLRNIYQNLLHLMKSNNTFHIGGDEVDLDCWRNTKAAQNSSDMTEFWIDYTNRMIDNLKIANKNKLPENIILWSSPLTESYTALRKMKHKKNIIVQYWFGFPGVFLGEEFRVIFSTVGHWYLDCGFGPWKPSQKNGVCDPYTPWQEFYNYRPWHSELRRSLTEGGEVCLWSEQVAEESLETRIWPRAAAFAERVWSDPATFELDVYKRLDNFRDIMRYRGLQVSAIWPKWCTNNPGSCV